MGAVDGRKAIDRTTAEPAPPTVRHLQAVAEFGRYALVESDLDALLNGACSRIAQGLGVPYAAVLEHCGEADDFLVRAGAGWGPGVVGSARIPADRRHPQGLALRTGRPVVCGDLDTDRRFARPPLLQEYGVVALANVPILLDTGAFGVVEAVTPERRPFSEEEVGFLQGVATQIAGALHRRRTERSLRAALAERAVLRRELQHRVRNNLYVVTSLLGLQAGRIGDRAARAALLAAQHRVEAMGLAYGLLQAAPDIAHIDAGEHLAALCRALIGRDKAGGVTLALDLEPVRITLEVGVPLGLIVSELVSNSLRHAFPDGGGTIALRVGRVGDWVVLEVADDGRGMAAAGGTRPPARSGGLGLTLIEALALQLQGELAWPASERGVRCRITFAVPDEW